MIHKPMNNDNMNVQNNSNYTLPSICNNIYSNLTRSRRHSTLNKYKTIPLKYRNSVIECVEFPNGVYINEDGIPMPHIPVSDLLYDIEENDEFDEHDEHDENEEHENRQYDNDCKAGNEVYEGVTSDEDYDVDYKIESDMELSYGSVSDSTEIDSDSDVSISDSEMVENWQFFEIR